jgi:hypothetical protein
MHSQKGKNPPDSSPHHPKLDHQTQGALFLRSYMWSAGPQVKIPLHAITNELFPILFFLPGALCA